MMTSKLTFGQSRSLDLADESLVAHLSGPGVEILDDLAAAVAQALADPLGFPPLRQAIVPDDQVALMVDPSLPQCELIVGAVIDVLLSAGISPQAITVVRGQFDERDPCQTLAGPLREQVVVTTHDPTCRDDLAYVAASAEGKPVYVNRAIVDADFVLPIGVLRADGAHGYHGLHSCWFPEFSDQKTLDRHRAPSSFESPVGRRRRREEAQQSAWLLGVLMTLQVVPAGGERILQVLAGSVASMAEVGSELCNAAWKLPINQTASLVVATIEGPPAQQTWNHVARALAAATAWAEEGGVIALCCDVSCPPGDVLCLISDNDELDEGGLEAAAREIRRHRGRDAAMAAQLIRTLQTTKVYLLSQLDQPTVESMGMAYVADVDEIIRLSHRHRSCILLDNADLIVPDFQNDESEGDAP